MRIGNQRLVTGCITALSLGLVTGCQTEMVALGTAATLPHVITFTRPGLYPEGVDYDPRGKRFLVTSMREGVVGEVSDDGRYRALTHDPALVSAVGLRIDNRRDRLLVCNSDLGVSVKTAAATQKRLAKLAIYRLSTGERLQQLDLAAGIDGAHFCNDIALDAAGNAYVTDSFSPIIYKVDVENRVSVLINNPRFTGDGFNLNGIVHKEDYLLVAKMNEGLLFKVPLNNPNAFSQVKVDRELDGADGLMWGRDGSLIVIANVATNQVIKLVSHDGWSSAVITGVSSTGEVFATTGVLRDGAVYVLNAMLHVMFNPQRKGHTQQFEIRKHPL